LSRSGLDRQLDQFDLLGIVFLMIVERTGDLDFNLAVKGFVARKLDNEWHFSDSKTEYEAVKSELSK